MGTPYVLSIEACDAIRPKLNCFISMIISVAKLSGFPLYLRGLQKPGGLGDVTCKSRLSLRTLNKKILQN